MTLVEKVKTASSKWIKTRHESLENFYWQNGYGGFSVSQDDVDSVAGYINKQHQYHSKIHFQDEYRSILKEHKVEYDERYVWD